MNLSKNTILITGGTSGHGFVFMHSILLNIDWNVFDRKYFGETLYNYSWFFGIAIGTLLLNKPLARLFTYISGSIANHYSYTKHSSEIQSKLLSPIRKLLQTVLYYAAVNQLDNLLDSIPIHHSTGKNEKINIRLGDIIDHIFLFLFIIFLTQVIVRFIDFIYHVRINKARQEKDYARQQLLPLTKEMSKLILWIMSAFWILGAVFHVNVPALITGLGIGGVAIALAGQATIANFFAAFTILSDKPFLTGDTVKIGDVEGKVERIGFRSTRLRNADGSAIIMPNQNLVNLNLINLSARDTRGIKITANIQYGISHEKLQLLINEIKETLRSTPLIKEPVEITFDTLDKEAMKLVVSYHLPYPLPDGTDLVTKKHEVNLMVFQIISKYAVHGMVE